MRGAFHSLWVVPVLLAALGLIVMFRGGATVTGGALFTGGCLFGIALAFLRGPAQLSDDLADPWADRL